LDGSRHGLRGVNLFGRKQLLKGRWYEGVSDSDILQQRAPRRNGHQALYPGAGLRPPDKISGCPRRSDDEAASFVKPASRQAVDTHACGGASMGHRLDAHTPPPSSPFPVADDTGPALPVL